MNLKIVEKSSRYKFLYQNYGLQNQRSIHTVFTVFLDRVLLESQPVLRVLKKDKINIKETITMAFFDQFKKQNRTDGREPEPSARSQRDLVDFFPCDTGLSQKVQSLVQEYQNRIPKRKPCGRDEFFSLLAGIAALRKTPGIPGPDNLPLTALPRCASPEDEAACRAHLERVFGITDKDSLLDFCQQEILCNRQYLDFVAFWEGRPPFALEELNKEAREFFKAARDFSAQFYPIVGHRGYLAWDISECMGHLRNGYACGLLSRKEFDELAEYWLIQAQSFKNWVEFAASLVCGELYWDFRHGTKLPELDKGMQLWMRLVSILLDNDAAWGSGMWYVPPKD